MADKVTFAVRCDAVLLARLDAKAAEHGWGAYQARPDVRGGTHGGRDSGRSALVRHLLEAYVEDRVYAVPRSGVNPFPASGEVEYGSLAAYPLPVTLGCRDPEPALDPSNPLTPSVSDED